MLTVQLAQLSRGDLLDLEQAIIPNFAGRNLGILLSGGAAGSGGYGLISALFWIAGSLLLIYLIIGGYKLMTSAGDPKKAAGAKQTITNAFIGMVVVFVAYWIVQILLTVLGLDDQGVFI